MSVISITSAIKLFMEILLLCFTLETGELQNKTISLVKKGENILQFTYSGDNKSGKIILKNNEATYPMKITRTSAHEFVIDKNNSILKLNMEHYYRQLKSIKNRKNIILYTSNNKPLYIINDNNTIYLVHPSEDLVIKIQ